MIFLGYKKSSLEYFYDKVGHDYNPKVGTANNILGYNLNNKTYRYTMPILHKNSTCNCDDKHMPIIGSIQGNITDVIYAINSDCPLEELKKGLITYQDALELGYFEVNND